MELARRHIPVVVRAPVHPIRDTQTNCSQGAGGLWMPIYCADPRLEPWSMEVRTIVIGEYRAEGCRLLSLLFIMIEWDEEKNDKKKISVHPVFLSQ